MPDRTEEFLRLALENRQRPSPAPTLAADILTVARANELARHARERWMSRALLGVYWLAAGIGSLWILYSTLGSISWPAWTPAALSRVYGWLVPIGCAVLLWHSSFMQWLVLCCTQLLQPFPQPDRNDPDHQGDGR